MYVQSLEDALDLSVANRTTGEALLTGGSLRVEGGRIYGGQFLGQSAAAAAVTVDGERRLHSMHAYFLLPGDTRLPVDYRVTVLRDGRSFSSRRVEGLQDERVACMATLSFQLPSDGIDHQFDLPLEIPAPDDPGLIPLFPPPTAEDPQAEELIEVRIIPPHGWESPIPGQVAAWVRLREGFDGDQNAQRAALAFLSDAIIQYPVLQGHGLEWDTPGTSMASLDHALWWHADVSVSEWMIFVQESPNARDGRAMTTGRIYSSDGRILATCAQEMLVRTRTR